MSWLFFLTMALFGSTAEPKPLFVASTPPVAMIAAELVGGRAELHTLLPNGASPHTFDPKPSDLAWASKAQALLFVSPELESWAAKLPARQHIALLPLLPLSSRLPAPSADDEHGLYDPHFWTDPRAVREILPGLANQLCAADPLGCDSYKKNATLFSQRLTALEAEAGTRLGGLKGRAVLASHPFFQYFFARFGAAPRQVIVPSCEHEPTPRTLSAIFAYVAANRIRVVFSARQDSQRPAQVVAEQAGTKTVVLDGLGAQEQGYTAWFSAQAARVAEALR